MSANDVHVPSLAARTLACAVIKQAMLDALDPTAPADVRHDAEQFLEGDSWYEMWCETAGLKPTPLLSRRH
jgi:hypothetical protein